ncbi:tryptophan 2,3-dioxygenase [Jatrophihabitans endophyticus]|uniref:Tryptophan 2,3-dioxygenase n=1 Tax=Jatrophihabitans endophyticus TaxID=1206085 RepID=A0A1M5CNY0_9ACTN|nr:tryptophan 2,3-dioxygenase family protein [Jatrophihabitans endophyticus]SHF56465.1 tryptophan 2,3-dioxygenase [Jatrophihabitans endophyticus]
MTDPVQDTDTGPLSARERAARADASGGEPIGAVETRSPYLDYEHIDTLLSLQTPRTAEPAEMSFFVMGQVKELLFKLAHHEFAAARDQLAADDIAGALWTMRRAAPVQRMLLEAWQSLSRLSPVEFANFRDALGAASGVQSEMYRRLEIVLGHRQIHPSLLDTPGLGAALRDELSRPSLYDEAVRLVARRGFPAAPDDPAALRHAWAEVYRAGGELALLAEALSDVAFAFHSWRAVHVLVVEKMIGDLPGSGGTSGLAWLHEVNRHRFFPELWAARAGL